MSSSKHPSYAADDEPPMKRPKQRRIAESERRRAVRACDGCRRQKEKCEGGIPCHRCVRFDRECEFNGLDNSTSRDLRNNPGDDVNIAEILERCENMEKLLRHHVQGISLDAGTLRRMAGDLPNGNTHVSPSMEETLNAEKPTDQGSFHESEDLNLDEHFSVKPLAHNTTHYSGEFSYWNFSMRIKQWIDDWIPHTNTEDSQGAPNVKEFYRAEQLESSSHELVTSLSNLPPRHVAEFLVGIFFKYAETNYFYIERTWLEKAMSIAYENPSLLSSKDTGTVCSLLIVLAIGTQYAYLDSESSREMSHAKSLGIEKSPFSEDDVGRMFFQKASKLIPDLITVASLESVQACLLIGLYTLPLDTSGLSYIYLNLAVKLGIQNGMHRKCVGDGFPAVTVELRNRVWWTAFAVERRVCIFHGRPISILLSDIDAEEPVDLPEMRPTTGPSNITNMLASIKLTRFLEDLAHEVSVLRRCQKNEQAVHLGILTKTKNELLSWWSTLPEETFCKDTNPQSQLFRPNMHLKLEYCLIRMYVGRPFLFSQHSSTSPSSVVDEYGHPTTRVSTRSVLIDDCVQAAQEVIDICRCLRNGAGLARASYTEFSSCRAALLVIIAQSLHKKTAALKEALQDGMSMIRMMSTGGDSARSEVSLIEAFEKAISRMDSFGETVRSSATISGLTGYDRFKDWEQLWKGDPVATNRHHKQTPLIPTPSPSLGHPYIPAGNPSTSLFGIDNFPYPYAQVVEEFSAIPTFDYDFEGGMPGSQWDMDQI